MRKIFKAMIAFSFLIALASCYKDLGNYDYTTLPEVSLTGKDTLHVTQFETLDLAIDVDLDGEPEENYEFIWRIWFNGIDNNEQKEIAYTKNLNYQVTESPGSYSLVLTCRNKSTKVNVYKKILLTVQGVISEGWMVLHEKDGESDFDLIMTPFLSNRYSEEKILTDLYESVNGEPLVGRGKKIASYFAIGRYQNISLLTEDGGVKLSPITMQKTFDFPALMLDNKLLDVQNYGYYSYYWCLGRGNETIVSDGRFYINELIGQGFTEPIRRNGETYKASAWGPKWVWTYKAMFYDDLNGRFLGVVDPLLSITELPRAEGRLFDWNNLKGNLRYMETGFNFYEYGVIEDWQTKKQTLYVLDFDVKNNFDKAMYAMDGCPEIEEANHYAIGNRGNVFYYSTDKDIYQYDYFGSNTASKVYTASQGEKITNMKIFKSNLDRYFPNHPYDNKVLIFSTYNDATSEGKVYMYYINESNGVIDRTSEKVYGGYGKILDMEYHFPQYGT